MKIFRNLKFILSIIIIFLFIASLIFQDEIKSIITKDVLAYGSIIIFIFALFLDLFPQYISPHLLILQLKIINFYSTTSLIIIIFGSVMGSIIGFEIGKKYRIKFTKKIYKKDHKKIQKKIDKYGKYIISLAAISPIPYIPLIFGSLGMKNKTFFIFGLIPRILGLIVFSLIIN